MMPLRLPGARRNGPPTKRGAPRSCPAQDIDERHFRRSAWSATASHGPPNVIDTRGLSHCRLSMLTARPGSTKASTSTSFRTNSAGPPQPVRRGYPGNQPTRSNWCGTRTRCGCHHPRIPSDPRNRTLPPAEPVRPSTLLIEAARSRERVGQWLRCGRRPMRCAVDLLMEFSAAIRVIVNA